MSGILRSDFDYVRELVYRQSAIALGPDKTYLVESRLLSLARQEGLASLGELMTQLRGASVHGERINGLRNKVVEAMTTNETSFFRDAHPFDALREHVLPGLERAGSISIWCAACSTGQEPYSVAMTISEHFPALVRKTQITATDLSTEVLASADAGRYSQLEVNRGLPVTLLTKYLDKRGLKWQIKPEIRRMVSFRQLNLANAWPAVPAADVVFLRNVLIYFDAATKKAILAKTRRVLKPGGYLFLGAAETTLNLDAAFDRVTLGRSTCYRLG